MKRIITFIIAATMCLVLGACGNRITTENSSEENVESLTETHISDNMNTNESPDTEVQTVDLVGPWHLDQEKNDISAIEAAWETFPGYGEWGASMEIRSNGQMSWYIGAVGGSGTYTVEGDVLHVELTDSTEQKEATMDFLIVGKDAIKMTYSDTEIIWAYGDQEDIPANGE